jgi:hypothetical protein
MGKDTVPYLWEKVGRDHLNTYGFGHFLLDFVRIREREKDPVKAKPLLAMAFPGVNQYTLDRGENKRVELIVDEIISKYWPALV